ncbi:MAG: hypothetical protein SFX18_14720 [Pirellulales bacterium]|nr:hypothetical protein [Pirellulales bacterium]
MAKGFAIFGMLVAGLFLVIFTMDLAAGIPFGGESTLTDSFFIVASLALGYMGWLSYREQS